MRRLLRGKAAGAIGWLIIATLVLGGLGWATAAALQLEHDQRLQSAEAEQAALLRLALWRLDSRVAPLLAREDSRPYSHYSAVFAVPLAFSRAGKTYPPGTVLEPSPLLTSEVPEWMVLHFQASQVGWQSPQVLAPALRRSMSRLAHASSLANATTGRQQTLEKLQHSLGAQALLATAHAHARSDAAAETTTVVLPIPEQPPYQTNRGANAPPQQLTQGSQQPEYLARQEVIQQAANEGQSRNPGRVQRDLAMNNTEGNGYNWLNDSGPPKDGAEVVVQVTGLVPVWLEVGAEEELLLLRLVRIGSREGCQGILLDWKRLEKILLAAVADLFPDARLIPMREAEPAFPERTMTALPLMLETGPLPAPLPTPGWTPLRVGLALAWLAALVALAAVGLGGWSLLALSERRMRFVWAVTHELRTPLTTLRLYLDMLQSGMVREEQRREEYIATLNTESNRLHNLIRNVLAFARLEKQRPVCTRTPVVVAELLQQVRSAWEGRCQEAGKELIVGSSLPADAVVGTDSELVQQVLGNLIDNACKYSRDAADRRLWVRARLAGARLIFEVEDRGPGIRPGERRAVFRVFRRGRDADVTAGGVGLGLALARRWARLLGGRLTLHCPADSTGACFRLDLPPR
jgi:signal transduction histidine kinase